MFDWGKALTIMLLSIFCVVFMSVFADDSEAKKTYKYFNRFDNTYQFGTDYRKSSVKPKRRCCHNGNNKNKHLNKRHKHHKNYRYKNGYYKNRYSTQSRYYPNSGYYSVSYPNGYVVNYSPYNYYYGSTTYPTVTYTKKHNPNPYFDRSRPNPYFSR